MELPNYEEIQFFDRLVRSYISAQLDDDFYGANEILAQIDSFKDNPFYTVHILTTMTAVTDFLLNHMVMDDDEEPLDIWNEMSLEIEMSQLSDTDGPEV